MKIKICITAIAFVLAGFNSNAQEWKTKGVANVYELARKSAFNGNIPEAQAMLLHILDLTPNDHPVRTFLARTYSWDGMKSEARAHLHIVLEKLPADAEALQLSISLELQDERYGNALALLDTAIVNHADKPEFLYQKAVILHQLDLQEQSLEAVATLLKISPSHIRGNHLRLELGKI